VEERFQAETGKNLGIQKAAKLLESVLECTKRREGSNEVAVVKDQIAPGLEGEVRSLAFTLGKELMRSE
jgi:hypothetical protein